MCFGNRYQPQHKVPFRIVISKDLYNEKRCNGADFDAQFDGEGEGEGEGSARRGHTIEAGNSKAGEQEGGAAMTVLSPGAASKLSGVEGVNDTSNPYDGTADLDPGSFTWTKSGLKPSVEGSIERGGSPADAEPETKRGSTRQSRLASSPSRNKAARTGKIKDSTRAAITGRENLPPIFDSHHEDTKTPKAPAPAETKPREKKTASRKVRSAPAAKDSIGHRAAKDTIASAPLEVFHMPFRRVTRSMAKSADKDVVRALCLMNADMR
ncbi:hypothetical protein EV182_000908 [Spiromyces aspiralis]|uniref:Uncharacterized protein n=1 Tax=Spiromyces aspiralis TaxID=68401 RepID=A0ACC1HXP2_9FUNG|nr:hypothetical protein EV182_000908 [Spiromyces aspiralis]